jgi:hypothetical protein
MTWEPGDVIALAALALAGLTTYLSGRREERRQAARFVHEHRMQLQQTAWEKMTTALDGLMRSSINLHFGDQHAIKDPSIARQARAESSTAREHAYQASTAIRWLQGLGWSSQIRSQADKCQAMTQELTFKHNHFINATYQIKPDSDGWLTFNERTDEIREFIGQVATEYFLLSDLLRQQQE